MSGTPDRLTHMGGVPVASEGNFTGWWGNDTWFVDFDNGIRANSKGKDDIKNHYEPHVKILRDFRDRFLLHNSVGNSFIRLYYTYSPPMAYFIAKHDSLRAMVRKSLLPVVGVSWIAL